MTNKDINVPVKDCISRAEAIDDLHGKDPSQIWDTADIEVWVNALPSAQPEPCKDAVSRADVVDMLEMFPFTEYSEYETAREVVKRLPSAQPEKEKAKRVLWTGWKGCRYTRYKCPNCKKPVKNDDIYCHRCGQRLMFPHISFTDYIPGEKQETIVRWDDE